MAEENPNDIVTDTADGPKLMVDIEELNGIKPYESDKNSDVEAKLSDSENITAEFDINKRNSKDINRRSERMTRMSVTAKSDMSTVEFVEPLEGTPAAEALAANAAIKVSKVAKGLKMLRNMKRPKLKSLNIVKKLNKTTKHKRKNHFSKNFKGKVIDGVHERYALTAGMMLGIRYSVSQTTPEIEQDVLKISDFNFVEKVTFPPQGCNIPGKMTPPHKLAHTYKFKSYSPMVFKRIREFFGIDPVNYMLSVAGDYNFLEFISNSKSGMYFFYSHDGKYMIKTQTKEENKFMKRILPHYYKFITENPHTTMVRIFGMHRVKMYHLKRKSHFVIMRSVFDSPVNIHTIYDLKGSSIGRSATAEEREKGGVLKDNDLIADNTKIHLGSKRQAFIKQLEKDAMFLASLNIMDYSLLLGIHDRKRRVVSLVGAPLSSSTANNDINLNASLDISPLRSSLTRQATTRSNTPFRTSVTAFSGSGLLPALNASGPLPSLGNTSESNVVDMQAAVNAGRSAQPKKLQGTPSNSAYHSYGRTQHAEDSPSKRLSFPADGDESTALATASADAADPAVNFHLSFTDSDCVARDMDAVGIAMMATLDDDAFSEESVIADEEEEVDPEVDDIDIDEGDSDFDDDVRQHAVDSLQDGDSDSHHRLEDFHVTAATTAAVHQAADEGHDDNALSVPADIAQLVQEDAVGAMGIEGYRLSRVFRSPEAILTLHGHVHDKPDRLITRTTHALHNLSISLSPKSEEAERTASVTDREGQELTYGPGNTASHPWTNRADEGINSRYYGGGGGAGRGKQQQQQQQQQRGDEIYFVGIIDILQEYNLHKRAETFLKGFTHDKNKLSSVEPWTYAKRFVKYIEDNSD